MTEDAVNMTIVTHHEVAPTGENNLKRPCYKMIISSIVSLMFLEPYPGFLLFLS